MSILSYKHSIHTYTDEIHTYYAVSVEATSPVADSLKL